MRAAAAESLLARLAGRPDRFPGALLVSGPSEARLDAESRRLAARLLCPGEDPEGLCGSCRRVEAGIHPDLFSIAPEGVQIRVDRVREALVFGAGRPYEAPRRVARILRADRLGVEGANALLKSLEEPGERFRWILTTARPDSLLATIRSRCVRFAYPARPLSERMREWRERGFSEDDARDLSALAGEAGDDSDPAARLDAARERRQWLVQALEEGLSAGRLPPLLMLAETVSGAENEEDARLLAEILADAAVAAHAPSSEALRHWAVAGRLAALGQHVGAAALGEAASAAADPPADNRMGNRRMHFEKALLRLFEAARR